MSGLIIVIDGGSSAGKSSIVRELQKVLPELWLGLGIDTFIGALPPRLTGDGSGIRFENDGRVDVGNSFTDLENLWMLAIGAIGRAGGHVSVDDGFLGGPRVRRTAGQDSVALSTPNHASKAMNPSRRYAERWEATAASSQQRKLRGNHGCVEPGRATRPRSRTVQPAASLLRRCSPCPRQRLHITPLNCA